MLCRAQSIAVLAALAFALPASAATVTLDLTGQVAGFNNPSTIVFGGNKFVIYATALNDAHGLLPVTVAQGDTIDIAATLDQAYTIAASQLRTDLRLFLNGPISGNTQLTGTIDLFNGSMHVGTYTATTTTSGFLALVPNIFPPNNGPITFTSLTSAFTIDALAAPSQISGLNFGYDLVSNAVPEPSGMLLFGVMVGIAGLVERNRRKR